MDCGDGEERLGYDPEKYFKSTNMKPRIILPPESYKKYLL